METVEIVRSSPRSRFRRFLPYLVALTALIIASVSFSLYERNKVLQAKYELDVQLELLDRGVDAAVLQTYVSHIGVTIASSSLSAAEKKDIESDLSRLSAGVKEIGERVNLLKKMVARQRYSHATSLVGQAYAEIPQPRPDERDIPLMKNWMMTIMFGMVLVMTVGSFFTLIFSKQEKAVSWSLDFLKVAVGFFFGTLGTAFK